MEEQILNKMKSGFLYEKCNKVLYLYIFLQTLPETFSESYLGIPENKNFREKKAKLREDFFSFYANFLRKEVEISAIFCIFTKKL